MIVTCSYEELAALRAGAEAMLHAPPDTRAPDAPDPTRTALESLLDRLAGDLSLSTLADQMAVEHAVRAVVGHLRSEMEVCVVSGHPAAEASVAAYFEFRARAVGAGTRSGDRKPDAPDGGSDDRLAGGRRHDPHIRLSRLTRTISARPGHLAALGRRGPGHGSFPVFSRQTGCSGLWDCRSRPP